MPKQTIKTPDAAGQPKLRIGAVSKLTRIPVDTLRAWERRYGVVEPRRTESSARLYTETDVQRLKVIKQLVDRGHAIGTVAGLGKDDLDDLLGQHRESGPQDDVDAPVVRTIVAFGDGHVPLDKLVVEGDELSVVAQHRSWADFESEVLTSRPDALVIEIGALVEDVTGDIVRLVRRSAARRAIVVYSFAPSALVERLNAETVTTLRAPVNREQLVRELRRPRVPVMRPFNDDEIELPDRLLDDAALATFAGLPTAVQCECPHHLVDIVRTLVHFERYSAECENRDSEDAALHGRLRATTAVARARFERALIEVAEYEGLDLPDGVRTGGNAADSGS